MLLYFMHYLFVIYALKSIKSCFDFRSHNEYFLEGMDGMASTEGIMSLVDIGRHLLGYEGVYSYGFLRKMACSGNCSGHGQCLNGSCYCMIQYQAKILYKDA